MLFSCSGSHTSLFLTLQHKAILALCWRWLLVTFFDILWIRGLLRLGKNMHWMNHNPNLQWASSTILRIRALNKISEERVVCRGINAYVYRRTSEVCAGICIRLACDGDLATEVIACLTFYESCNNGLNAADKKNIVLGGFLFSQNNHDDIRLGLSPAANTPHYSIFVKCSIFLMSPPQSAFSLASSSTPR